MAIAFAGFGAQPASAHNALATSVPAAGAVLSEVPASWALTFTKDVPLDSASAELVAASGVRTALPAPTYGVSKKEILFALPPDLNGAMTGRWRLVGADGAIHKLAAQVFSLMAARLLPQGPGQFRGGGCRAGGEP